jgi:hypothetical protein
MYPESLYPDPDIQRMVKQYDQQTELKTYKVPDRCYLDCIIDGNEPSQIEISPEFSGHISYLQTYMIDSN